MGENFLLFHQGSYEAPFYWEACPCNIHDIPKTFSMYSKTREYEPTIFRVGLALFLTDIANKWICYAEIYLNNPSTGSARVTLKDCYGDYFHLLKSFRLWVLKCAGSYLRVYTVGFQGDKAWKSNERSYLIYFLACMFPYDKNKFKNICSAFQK